MVYYPMSIRTTLSVLCPVEGNSNITNLYSLLRSLCPSVLCCLGHFPSHPYEAGMTSRTKPQFQEESHYFCGRNLTLMRSNDWILNPFPKIVFFLILGLTKSGENEKQE